MRVKLLLLLILMTTCTTIEKPKVDYDRGWIIDQDGSRHFYKDEIIIGKEMFCLIHRQNEIVYLKKELDQE
tara:strand:- start:524 stop:736 length:213 start_codon:yes stop_codon:yes gene_type:complete